MRQTTIEYRAKLFAEDPNTIVEQKSFVTYEEAAGWLQAMLNADAGKNGLVEFEKHTLH